LDYFRTVYLIYDQFEEFFIQSSEKEREAFCYFLKECLSSKLNVKIIIIIREEYLGSLDEFEQRMPNFMENCFRLERMSKKVIKKVMGDIFRDNGIIEYEPINVSKDEKLVHDDDIDEEELSQIKKKEKEEYPNLKTKNQPDVSVDIQDARDLIYDNIKDSVAKTVDLPYMQVYLDKLIRKLPESTHKLTRADINSIGKLEDVLAAFLGESVDTIASKLGCPKDELWTVLNCLVSVDGTKQALKQEDIKKTLEILND